MARWSVSTVFFVNGVGIGLWAAHIPMVQARLFLDEGLLGVVLLAVAAGAMTAMPLAGAAAERFGGRRATQAMAFAFALSLPLPILAPTLPALFIAAFIFGACNGALDVAMNAHASDVEIARGTPTMSSFHGFFSLGGLAGAALGGGLIKAGLGDGLGMTVAAGAAVLALIPTASRLLAEAARPDVPASSHFVWPRRTALALGLLALLCMAVEGAVADWSALLLTGHSGASAATAAIGYGAFSIAMAGCRFGGDALIARFGPRWVMAVGGASIAAGLLAAGLIGNPFAAAAGFGLVGLGAANVVPVVFAAAARAPGPSPGASLATAATIGYTGFLLGPPAIGWIASVTDLATALTLLSSAGLLIAASAGAVSRRKE